MLGADIAGRYTPCMGNPVAAVLHAVALRQRQEPGKDR